VAARKSSGGGSRKAARKGAKKAASRSARKGSAGRSAGRKSARKAAPRKRGAGGVAARRRRRERRRRLRAIGALGAFLVGLAAASWVLSLDAVVRERFDGRRFTVPSKVFAAPIILYPGLDWQQLDLIGTLQRLGYREQAGGGALESGRFRRTPGKLRVSLRGFAHPTRREPAQDVAVLTRGSRVAEIRDVRTGREVGAVPLEPALVGAFYGSQREQRELVAIDALPRHLIDAVLAVEDRRFESHHGVDLRRILGAFVANLRAGGIRQGGSTLTQQLVKNFFLTPERTVRRKLQEAVMALLVEARYEKPAILESYLNEIYLGQRGSTAIHGIGEAAVFYFGKPASDLGLAESALLAAIIQSPNRLSPHRNPRAATDRRNLVLELMFQQQRIDARQLDRARHRPLGLARVTPEQSESRYFLDLLRRQLPEAYDRDVLTAQGLRIYSTLDPRLQDAAARALKNGLARIEQQVPRLAERPAGARLQGCLVALRPQTGEILALVGGRDYGRSQFDRCTQARRPAGSVFKPFVYLAGLTPDRGAPHITLASRLDDEPIEVETEQGVWSPSNIDHEFRGRVPVRTALEKSLNVPAVRLALAVGVDRVAAVARRLGIESRMPRVPSLALGTAEVAPLEMARAYATLANGGIRPTPHTFEDVVAAGRTLDRRHLDFERVMPATHAYLATSLLQGVVERGTAASVRALGLRGPIAAKTGTSDEERDLWFVGFTPELVAVVWVGFDEPASVGVPSSRAALPIWAEFVREVVGERVRGDFLRPPGLVEHDIDPLTGALAGRGCPDREPEIFLPGTEPLEVCVGRNRIERRERGDDGGKNRRGLLRWVRDWL